MNTVYTEYRNQNAYRSYPFSDQASLRSVTGSLIPPDFIVDAMLYPIDMYNGLYLSCIDFNDKTLTFCDTVTHAAYAVGVWSDTGDTVQMYEALEPYRTVGMVVMGPGRLGHSVGGVLQFTPRATELTSAAYYPLNQPGVRGIVVGTQWFTGQVKFEGRGGVQVLSYVDSNGRSVLRFDITGVPDAMEPCHECNMLKCIKVTGSKASMIIAAPQSSNRASFTTPFDLSAICAPSNVKLPSQRVNPCDDPVVYDDVEPVKSGSFTICPANGRMYFETPSAPGYDNPLRVETREDPAPPPDLGKLSGITGVSSAKRELAMARLFDVTKLTRGTVSLGYRGLDVGKHR